VLKGYYNCPVKASKKKTSSRHFFFNSAIKKDKEMIYLNFYLIYLIDTENGVNLSFIMQNYVFV
jgi:hypothetical protein